MDNRKLASAHMRKVLGCFVFDIALIIVYFKAFGLFFIVDPGRSVLMIFVLLLGLMILNLVVAFEDILFIRIGIPYNAVNITLVVLYVIVANIFSVFLIKGSIILYVIWQLIIFAVFIGIFIIIVAFSEDTAKKIIRVKNQQAEKAFLMQQLLEIEEAFDAKEDQENILKYVNQFKGLKEQIQFSTPFGRSISNNEVLNAEKKINNNLQSLKVSIKENSTDENLIELQKIIEGTRQLVINREELNIR